MHDLNLNTLQRSFSFADVDVLVAQHIAKEISRRIRPLDIFWSLAGLSIRKRGKSWSIGPLS